jgi:hypothetical protein
MCLSQLTGIPFILETARLLAALIRRRREIPMILGLSI